MNSFNRPQPRPAVRQMNAYSPGKPIWEVKEELALDHVIKLASNENPLGASPLAQEAILRHLTDIHRYPDARSQKLKEAIAAVYGVTPDHILTGNGADELITLISETFLTEDHEVIVPTPSFTEYEFGAQLMGATVVPVPLTEDYQYDIRGILEAVTPRTKILYLCSPNNPTGTYLPRCQLNDLLKKLPSSILVVVDAAYSHYATEVDYTDGLEYVRAGCPILVLNTFSKIYGLAGIRVGFALSDPRIIRDIHRCKEPFNVNLLAQHAAAAALYDEEHVRASRRTVENGRISLYGAFDRLGIRFTPSMGNFVLIRVGDRAPDIYEALLRRGIIVRKGDTWGLPDHLRISVGSEEENEAFVRALEEIAGESRLAV
ncbi:histidinol-phosphate transaminase [Paenibacillus aurantius]|uniref:Histidinol-phosphate aminotransferase n=1 Tax=Paenibacillus aurantius TaxID=2918900 RepID=A0AA96L9T5_9BACL|nr:histidinol-phosphate transaminase [Paenibacillus aurantius]WNQ09348.1 histidinol-phosphate transaminase [Paenibacillus aurantius]